MTKDEWYTQLFERLGQSKFRSRFHLKQVDIDYINSKGLDKIEEHARDFIAKREAPSVIPNDGKQTPMHGHPVFIAQHATATCCRECIRELSEYHNSVSVNFAGSYPSRPFDVTLKYLRKPWTGRLPEPKR